MTIAVAPTDRPPVAGTLAPVDAIGGRPTGIAVLPAASDPDGDSLTVTAASTATGTVVVNADNTITYTPPLGFVGTTTIGYTLSDGRGGTASGTIVVRVAQGAAADIEQLLRIGRVTFNDLRGTAVTRLAIAGCTEAEIATITGHSLRDVRSILDAHYLHRDAALADSAIRKLEENTVATKSPN